MGSLLADIRYAARSLVRSPGFALAVIVTLALGIGANTTMFGVLDVLLLRPPQHVTRPDRVARVYFRHRSPPPYESYTGPSTSVPVYETLRDGAAGFASVAAFVVGEQSLGRGATARQAKVMLASSTFFPTLGVSPALGRFYDGEEDRPGGARVAVLSYGFWRRQFAGDSSVLGRGLSLGTGTYTVVGVAPDGFTGVDLTGPEIWVPLSVAAPEFLWPGALSGRGSFFLQVVARLRDGLTREDAAAQATPVHRSGALAGRDLNDTATSVVLGPIQAARGPETTGDTKVSVWIGVVAAVVLLIACANVANLLLARGVGRRREIAVRLGLGASRGRVIRLLLVESLVLGLAGGAAALLVAAWFGALVRAFFLPGLPESVAILEWRVLGFTAGVALVAGALAGIAPALQSVRTDVAIALKSGGGGALGGRGRLRTALVAAQIALTAVLLIGAGLFVRSLRIVRELDVGVDLGRVLYASVDLEAAGMGRSVSDAVHLKLLERIQAQSMVSLAAASVGQPFASGGAVGVQAAGVASLPRLKSGGPYFSAVTPDFFATLGLRILRGRGFTSADGPGAAPVVVVGSTFGQLVWAGLDPIGKCLYINGPRHGECVQVVGVVEDTRRFQIIEEPSLQYYVPFAQHIVDQPVNGLLIRTKGRATEAAVAVQRALQGAEPDLPYVSVESLEDRVAPQLRSWRLGATMFAAFGLLALAVAAMGLYGVTAYLVSQRTQEIGLRIALGAQRGDVLRLVVGQGMRAASIGAVLGVLGALALGRAIASLLYGVRPTDPVVFGTVMIVLLVVAGIAAFLPARRATRVDPMVALRSE